MKYWLISLLLASTVTSRGQNKQLEVGSDTAFWFELKQHDATKIGLNDLSKAKDSLHFRYWMENQSLEIWTNDYQIFYGILSNHTETAEGDPDNRKKNRSKYYSNKINLTPSEAKGIYDLFIQANFFQIPTDKQIKNWSQGFDGFEYLAEYSTRSTYSFKTYWTPSAQNGVPEADTINHLNQKLESFLELKSRWDDFFNRLPPGAYRVGEMIEVYIVPHSDGDLRPDEILH
jgi:hypothetical protein